MNRQQPAGLLRCIALLFLTSAALTWAQQSPLALSPERTKAAFAWGLTAPEKDLAQYELHSDVSWLVNFDTPWLRVAQFARASKIQGQNATESDIPKAIEAPEIQVYAHAKLDAAADKSGLRLPDINYLSVLRLRKDRPDETILPLSVQTFIRRVPQDDVFATRTRIARSARASFPVEAFSAGNRLRIIFDGGAIVTIPISEALLTSIR